MFMRTVSSRLDLIFLMCCGVARAATGIAEPHLRLSAPGKNCNAAL
jgi:hypothetical protein